jgi:hypothetical protein
MSMRKAIGCVSCTVGRSLIAGLAGTAAITASQTVEMAMTGRKPSSTPAQAFEKVLGLSPLDARHEARLAHLVHWGYGTAWGLFRGLLGLLGLRGVRASLIHWGTISGAAVALLPRLGIAPPARRWPLRTHAVEALHHLVYATTVGCLYDLMSPEKSKRGPCKRKWRMRKAHA